MSVEDADGGIALDDPPQLPPTQVRGDPTTSLLRSIDTRLEVIGRATMLRDPARPIVYAIIVALIIWTVVLPGAIFALWLLIQINRAG